MKKTLSANAAALALGLSLATQPLGLLAAAADIPLPVEIARGGGGGGGGRGGRAGSGARTGFASFGGGGSRSQDRTISGSDRSTNRNTRVDTRQSNRTDRTDLRQSNRTERTDLRQSNRPAWVNNNWAVNRPWRYGWYGGSTWNNWAWWPGPAAAWGIGTLASFAVISSLVDSAVSNQITFIVVPDSDYSLDYGSVQVSGELVSFQADDGSSTASFQADCRAGTLNGYPPQIAGAAQLLNAACQVAFGQ